MHLANNRRALQVINAQGIILIWQGQTQKTSQFIVLGIKGQEMLLCAGCLIAKILVNQVTRCQRLATNFTTAHTLAFLTALFHFRRHILAQTGVAVALNHIRAGNVADNAIDPTIAWHSGFDIC